MANSWKLMGIRVAPRSGFSNLLLWSNSRKNNQ